MKPELLSTIDGQIKYRSIASSVINANFSSLSEPQPEIISKGYKLLRSEFRLFLRQWVIEGPFGSPITFLVVLGCGQAP